MFSIAYLVYRALGFNSYNYLDLLCVQVTVQLAVEMLPIPGGSLLSEMMFYNMFTLIFLSKNADTGMLLTRTFSFYIPILVSGLIILSYSVYDRVFKKKK